MKVKFFYGNIQHWIILDDNDQKTDSWIIGLNDSADDELIKFAIKNQFILENPNEIIEIDRGYCEDT